MRDHILVPPCFLAKARTGASMFIFVLFLALVIQSSTYAEPLAKITVEAGKHTRIDTPVAISLNGIPDCLPDAALRLEEIRVARRLPVPTQIEPGSPRRLWWILCGTTPAGGKRIYELVQGTGAPHVFLSKTRAGVEVVMSDAFLQIQAVHRTPIGGNSKILRYNHALVPPPEGASPLYTRSGFIHPLWSPTGAILTDIHPYDHIHHMGIWMPWTKTKFEEREVDFWNLKKGKGTVRFVKFLSTASGPVFGGFRTEHEHIDLSAPQGEKVALKEIWNVRVYNLGGPSTGRLSAGKNYWLWDFVSTQRCSADSPLHQLQHRYGGLGFRGGEQWFGENIGFLTSEGKTRKDGHGTRARWCDISGLSGKDWAGVTIMSHPENYRHPEPMRIHQRIPFFNFAPSQLGDWTMEPGQDYVFQYRFYVHEGRVSIANAERIWFDYTDPPKIKLKKISKKAGAKSDEEQKN